MAINKPSSAPQLDENQEARNTVGELDTNISSIQQITSMAEKRLLEGNTEDELWEHIRGQFEEKDASETTRETRGSLSSLQLDIEKSLNN